MNEQVFDAFHQQANELVLENRRLRAKSDADDGTIITLKKQYDDLSAGVEAMIEDHKAIETESQESFNKSLRELMFKCDRAERAYKEIEGLLSQAGHAALVVNELIVQAVRARIGDETPEKMPEANISEISDARLPPPSLKE